MVKSSTAFARIFVLSAAVTACGGVAPSIPLPGGGTTPQPGTPPTSIAAGWQVFNAEHLALWYHALALTRAGASSTGGGSVPIYKTGYADTIAAARRQMGVGTTPLERRASEFAQTFSDPSYTGLQFLPLYFQDAQALFNTIRAWEQAQGDPRSAGSQQAAQAIAFLSSQFPREAQRRAVADFARVVQEEHTAFFRNYWQNRLSGLNSLAASFRTEWSALQPSLRRFLEYAQVPSAEVFLVPALGGEGRTVTSGTQLPRLAVGATATAEQLTFEVIHELMYSIASDVITDNMAPAQIRDIGQDVLNSRVAVRGGAILLARVAPARVDAYRRFYLDQAGRSATAAQLAARFQETFPLPDVLQRGLEREIESALAGI